MAVKDIFQICFMWSETLQMYESCTAIKNMVRGLFEESPWSETQLRSQGQVLPSPCLHVVHKTNMVADLYEEIFPIMINDRSVGSIRLFAMINYEISANS